MTIDLTGGMDPAEDHFFAERPDDPEMRESASFWVSDDEGQIGIPRVGIEALAETWDKRDFQLNLGFADGRAVIVRGSGEGRSPVDDDGVCRTFQAGAPHLPSRRGVPDPDHDVRRHRDRHDVRRDGGRRARTR